MARSRPPRRPSPAPTRSTKAQRARRNRLLAGLAEVLRNLGVLFVGGPLLEPFINPGDPFGASQATLAIFGGLVLIAAALILDALRTDEP
jgi:hypothetical protein